LPYISPLSQNALITSVSNVIQQCSAAEVEAATYFSLLADETTEFATREQSSVCVRYVSDCSIRERLLCFATAPDLTGSGLSKQVLRIVDGAGQSSPGILNDHDDGVTQFSESFHI